MFSLFNGEWRVAGRDSAPKTVVPDVVRRHTLVAGLGNVLRGDDGVGVCVIKALLAESEGSMRPLLGDVELLDAGTQGFGLVSTFEGRERLILVDAADMGKVPGHVVRFTLEEAELFGADEHLSIHAAGLRDALRLAQALNMLPDEVVIYGVQPANVNWDAGLSPEIEAALPGLVAAVREEATGRGNDLQPTVRVLRAGDRGDNCGENLDD